MSDTVRFSTLGNEAEEMGDRWVFCFVRESRIGVLGRIGQEPLEDESEVRLDVASDCKTKYFSMNVE